MTRLALRSLHAVGLDIASVRIQVEENGRCSVNYIQVPETSELQEGIWRDAVRKFTELWMEAHKHSKTYSSIQPLLIGADPEFLLLSKQGRVVPAERYLRATMVLVVTLLLLGGR